MWDLNLYDDPILMSPIFISPLFNYSTDDEGNNNDTLPSVLSDHLGSPTQDSGKYSDIKDEQNSLANLNKVTPRRRLV